MAKVTKEQIEAFLNTPEAAAVLTLTAYAILKTPTKEDDLVVDNISDYTDILAEKLKEIADAEPTDAEAKEATMVLARKISQATTNKWDDRAVAVLDLFF
jgi:hypothetical protein